MLTTATSPEVLTDEILEKFSITNCRIIRAMTPRPEISYEMTVHAHASVAKSSLLCRVKTAMQSYKPNEKALIFCRRRDTVEAIATDLGCSPFHRDLPIDQLKSTWLEFTSGATPTVLVCSSAVGVGVDIRSVRDVWHYGMPWNLIDYVQESGRGGRDGRQAFSHLLTWNKELESKCSSYTEDDLRRLICQTTECRRTIIGEVLNNHPTSCAMLREPNLCDNCKRQIDDPHPRTVITTPQAPPPNPPSNFQHHGPPRPDLHTENVQRRPQSTPRAQPPAATIPPPALPRPATRPAVENRDRGQTRNTQLPQFRQNVSQTGSRTSGLMYSSSVSYPPPILVTVLKPFFPSIPLFIQIASFQKEAPTVERSGRNRNRWW